MIRIEEEIIINASKETIFSIYVDFSRYNEWDAVRTSTLHGDFKVGTTGTFTPLKGSEIKICLTEVTKNKSYSTETKLLFGSMRTEHELHDYEGKVKVIHRVIFSGLLAPFYNLFAGRKVRVGLKNAMPRLKKICESQSVLKKTSSSNFQGD